MWIKYDGRWSIELINDRNSPVSSCFIFGFHGTVRQTLVSALLGFFFSVSVCTSVVLFVLALFVCSDFLYFSSYVTIYLYIFVL